MPRTPRVPAVLRAEPLKKSKKGFLLPNTPRLWNAKVRIEQSRGLTSEQFRSYKNNPEQFDWKKYVSADVVEYLEKTTWLEPTEVDSVLKSPAHWFSRPHNVPAEQRQQIYFPEFGISFRRTPHLGPYYAQFDVPLDFNKLDMKQYLRHVYDVEVVHVRSAIYQSKVKRKTPLRAGGQGMLYRPASKKRMTVQLVDPFEWPEEVTDFEEWDRDNYHRTERMQYDANQAESRRWREMNPDEKHRKTIAEQAKDLLAGKASWKPTWQSLPLDSKVMSGSISAIPPPPPQTLMSTGLSSSRPATSR